MSNPIFHSQYTAAQIEAAIGKGPRVNASGYWEVWNIANMAYESTGVGAGVTPPTVVTQVSQMTNHAYVYIYNGTETGYTAGYWYYWDGSAWTAGGAYQVAATDPTLSVAGAAADAKATGELKSALGYDEYLINNGSYTIQASDLESGLWGYSTKVANAARARTKYLLPVRAGMQISYANTTFDTYFGVLATPTSSSYSQAIGWKTDGSGTVNITKDGYLTFIIRNHADTTTAVDPTDYNSTVTIRTTIIRDIDAAESALADIIVTTTSPNWEKGSFNSTTGENYADNTKIRMLNTVGYSKGFRKFKLNTGYIAYMYAWDQNNNYVGTYKTDGSWEAASSNWKPVTEFDLSTIPNYVLKLAVSRYPGSTAITASEGDQCILYRYTDETLTIAGKAADAKTVGIYLRAGDPSISPVVPARYLNASNISDVQDLPANSWMAESSSSLASKLGDKFRWELQSNTTYILTKWNVASSPYDCRYELAPMGNRIQYIGYTTAVSHSAITWYSQDEDNLNYNRAFQHQDDFFMYIPEDFLPGWINADGSIGNNTYPRTQKLPITPGKNLYITNNVYVLFQNTPIGAFYDVHGNFIRAIMGSNSAHVTEYAYDLDNGYVSYNSASSSNTIYVHLYEVVVPDNAYFVQFNTASSLHYCTIICTEPIYGVTGNGNWRIPAGDVTREMFKRRKLCVIGPSTVMINRMKPAPDKNFDQYIMGWQEYLKPYYGKVTSFGYSGASWRDNYVVGPTGYSIHIMTVGSQTYGISPRDLSQYDDFVLTSSLNGFTYDTMGAWDRNDPAFSTDTYLGALRDTIDYIYTQNGSARIFVGNFICHGGMSEAGIATRNAYNEEILNMCNFLGITYLNLNELCFNSNTMSIADGTYDRWTYDGTHYNQNGSRMFGMWYKKNLLVL